MKTLFRMLIVGTCLGIVYYYSNVEPTKTELLEGPPQISQPISTVELEKMSQDELPRPKTGISKYIGNNVSEILDNYGKPNRVDLSAYGYEWWIYQSNYEWLMVGVEEEKVTQVYTNAVSIDVAPYTISQSIDDIYRMTIFEQEVTVEIDNNIYIFAMNELDLKSRILVKYEDVFAQLYINIEKGQLEGVRFIDGETLVLHKPYELQFIGQLLESNTPSSFEQIEINLANSRQLTELTNAYRFKNKLPVLQQSTILASLASEQSEKEFLKNRESQLLETLSLEERLAEVGMDGQHFSENSAKNYSDAIEVIHGWINSKEHHGLLMDEKYTKIGSGAFVNYFTQIYISE